MKGARRQRGQRADVKRQSVRKDPTALDPRRPTGYSNSGAAQRFFVLAVFFSHRSFQPLSVSERHRCYDQLHSWAVSCTNAGY